MTPATSVDWGVLLEGVSVAVAHVRYVPVKVSEMIKRLEVDGWHLVR